MENNNGNKFLTGFLLGAIIGAGIVFFLGTKRGKKILKNLSEDGFDNIQELLENAGELEDEELPVPKEPAREMRYPVQMAETEVPKKPLVRRFFRGIHKKG